MVPWRIIGIFLVAHALWATLVNLGFRAGVPFLGTLSANLLGLAILVAGILFLVARLRPADVGLRIRDLPAGGLYTVAVFAFVQVGTLVVAAIDPSVHVLDHWNRYGIVTVLSLLSAQLFGNALYEEIAFRGFLLPQFYARLRRFGAVVAFVLAPVLSQLLFALAHVPNRLWVTGVAPAELPASLISLFVFGLYFALVYLLTHNLFAVVGVHSFINVPMLTLVADGGGDLYVLNVPMLTLVADGGGVHSFINVPMLTLVADGGGDLYVLNALVTLGASLSLAGAWWWWRRSAVIVHVRRQVA